MKICLIVFLDLPLQMLLCLLLLKTQSLPNRALFSLGEETLFPSVHVLTS